MEYGKLGLSDLKVSRLGFGCWAIGGHGYGRTDDNESIRAIQKALDLGITFYDTSDVYGFGHSEEILAKALGSNRDKVVIATKFGVSWDVNGKIYYDCSPRRIVEALEGSLRRLRISAIPLYQMHWYDNVTKISDILEVLKRCQEEGKIRYVGCSNVRLPLLLQIMAHGRIESFQCPYSLFQREFESEMISCMRQFNVGVIAYNVLTRGLFSGKYGVKTVFGDADTRSKDNNFKGEQLIRNLDFVSRLKKIGDSYKKTPSAVAIRWVLDHEYVASAIVGAVTEEHVSENYGAVDWNLSKDDFGYLGQEALCVKAGENLHDHNKSIPIQ